MRGLVDDERPGHAGKFGKAPGLVARLARQEPLEEEMLHAEATCHQSAGHGTGTRNDLDREPLVERRVDQALARIAHARHAGV